MTKRLPCLAICILAAAGWMLLPGCGSIGEGNTLSRPKQTLNTKDPQVGSKLLNDRQKASASKITAPTRTGSYLRDTGRSKIRRPKG